MITAGRNIGRVGLMESRERHAGSFDIIHVKDAAGQTFATRGSNVFIIGQSTKSLVSLPKRKGIKTSIIQEQQHRLSKEKKSKK
jgi:small subunit ribosomal protein S4e